MRRASAFVRVPAGPGGRMSVLPARCPAEVPDVGAGGTAAVRRWGDERGAITRGAGAAAAGQARPCPRRPPAVVVDNAEHVTECWPPGLLLLRVEGRFDPPREVLRRAFRPEV